MYGSSSNNVIPPKSITSESVTSVHGRTGDVVAAASDYDASEVDNDSGVSGSTVADALDTLDSGKAASSHIHAASDINSGTLADARVAESNVTQHEAALTITESQISDLDHTDSDAIHDNVSGEIAALTEKGSPVSGDLIIIEDSADTNSKKKVQIGNLPSGSSLPVDDTTAVVQDPGDNTKLVRIDAGAITTSTTRVITMGDRDVDLASGGTFAENSHNHAASEINSGTLAHERGGMEADVSAYTQSVPFIDSGTTTALKHNFTATTAPGTSNDNTEGYRVGSMWVDVTGAAVYVCEDASTGAANWIDVSAGAAGGETNTASNLGSGVGVYETKSSSDLQFNSLVGATGISVTEDDGNDEIDIALDINGLTDAGAFESGDKLVIHETGVGIRKIDYDDLPSGGSSLPVDDTTSLVQDPVDGTKEMRIDVGAVTTSTVRVLTMPDRDVDLSDGGTFAEADHVHLTQTGVKSAGYTASAGEHVLCDTNAATASDTFTAAVSDVVTFSSYNPTDGDEFTVASSGTLPTGLSVDTRYFAIDSSTNTCKFSATPGGSAVNITGTGSGTHTATLIAFPIALPGTPTAGDQVRVTLRTDHATKTVRIDPNGSSVNGSTDTAWLRLVLEGDSLLFEFVDGDSDWSVVSDALRAHAASMSRASAQSINNSSQTKVTLDTADYDRGGLADTTDNEIVIRRDGIYTICFSCGIANLDDQERMFTYLFKNGSQEEFYPNYVSSTLSDLTHAAAKTVQKSLVAGDTLDLRVFHQEGAAQNTSDPEIMVHEVR